MSRNTKFATGIGLAAILFTILGYSLFQSIEETNDKKELELHTMDVLEEINGLLMFNFEQESVFRGQLIFPQKNFVADFHKRKVKFQNSLYQLSNLVNDNPRQLKKIDSLEAIFDAKQMSYDKILFADSSNLNQITIKENIEEINKQSEAFKAVCRSMVSEENNLLEKREGEFDDQQMKSKQMLVFTFALTLFLIMAFIIIVGRNLIALNKASLELENKNDRLEILSERLESSLFQSEVAAFDWSDTTKEEFWISNSMFTMLEMEPEDFDATVTGFFSKHMHPDDSHQVQQQLVRHIEHGADYNPEYRLSKKGGDYMNFRALGSTKTVNGITRMTGVIMNIEKEIVERERYQNLFKHSYEALFLVNSDLEITEFNASFEKLMKYSQLTNLRLEKLFLKLREYEQLKDELLLGNSYAFKVKLKDAHGKILIANLTCWPVYGSAMDGDVHYQGEIHDVTELEQTQQKLIETEKLHLTGRMARIIGHEVRNPLTNILLAADELLQDELREDERELLGIVNRNSMRISKLIDDLLNSTKLLELNRSKVDLKKVVSSAIEKCNDRIALKRIQLILNDLNGPALICLDEEKFQIALVNIIINATEAMTNTENPKLIVSIEFVENKWKISIQDNGCGMSIETKKKIFDPFFTARNGGLGLGMTNVKNILLLHDAELYVTSEIDKGSTFIIQMKA